MLTIKIRSLCDILIKAEIVSIYPRSEIQK